MKLHHLFILFTILLIEACKSNPTPSEQMDEYPGYSSLCTTEASDKAWYASGQKAPLLPGLAGIDFPITTQSKEAQAYFDQGLMLAYGFNHAEAARAFFQATRIDSTCAMCYWGFAYVLGPNYNAGMEPDNHERAYAAIQKALTLSKNATPKEQALIKAMAARYPAQAVEDRSPYDQAYAAALKTVYEQFPNDADVAAMYAESLMDLHPWDLWETNGDPKSWTPEILQVIEKLIAMAPQHAGGHHLYIHATEASQTPEMGLASADALR
ncbi:MAG: hypothetical protein ACK4TA_19595, partial [Saprospiraceae bacterium]